MNANKRLRFEKSKCNASMIFDFSPTDLLNSIVSNNIYQKRLTDVRLKEERI